MATIRFRDRPGDRLLAAALRGERDLLAVRAKGGPTLAVLPWATLTRLVRRLDCQRLTISRLTRGRAGSRHPLRR